MVSEPLMELLKPCPFCGGNGKYNSETICIGHGDYLTEHFIFCQACGARGSVVTDRDKIEDVLSCVVDKWNRRTSN